MDSGELNKIAGGIIGAMLVFLLLGFFSHQIFVGPGHGDEERVLAFAVAVEEAAGGEAESGPDYAALLASADPASGEKAFNKCKACHQVEDGANGVGPHLWDVVGREIAGVGGYSYSDALAGKEGQWTLENLFGFLHNPSGWAPGTKMGFSGLSDHQDKVDLIVWLNEADGSPIEFDVPEAAAEEGAEETGEEQALLETAEGGGLADTEARDAEQPGVESTGSEAQEAASTTEEEAEAKIEEAAEGGDARYSEQQSGTDEQSAEVGQQIAEAGGGAFAPLLAEADAAAGEKAFRKCKACHKVEDGQNGVGPHLFGVIGREIASVDGFNYSDALASKEGAWTLENLDAFIADPKGWAPGTKMSFAGLKDPQDRVNLITYLNEADGTPEQLGSAGGAAAAETEVAEAPEPAAAEETAQADSEPEAEAAEAEAPAEEAEAEQPAAEAAEAGGGAFAPLLAEADAAAGEKAFRKCKACHKVEDGQNGVGPHLFGVIGREIASVEGFKYSNALSSKDGAWTLENLDAFIADPKGWAPGTKMTFAGVKDPQDRVNLITYLNEADGSPEKLGSTDTGADRATAPDAGTADDPEQADAEPGEEVGESPKEAAATPATTGEKTAAVAGPAPLEEVVAAVDEAAAAVEEAAAALAAGSAIGMARDGSDLLASADPGSGKKTFRKCLACHTLDREVDGLGPSLHGLMGREIASREGFAYSEALSADDGAWDYAKLDAFLASPHEEIGGVEVTFTGVPDPEERADLIAFIDATGSTAANRAQ